MIKFKVIENNLAEITRSISLNNIKNVRRRYVRR